MSWRVSAACLSARFAVFFGASHADKGQSVSGSRASRETVDRCHVYIYGIACRRFSGRADFRLRQLNGRAARVHPLVRGHCAGHLCRSGPYYRRGSSIWGRLASPMRNDGFWQAAGAHSRGRHAKTSPSISTFLRARRRQWDFAACPRMSGHNWRDVVAASVIDRVS